ncbi:MULTISPECIES: hypothetical protein [unclassified Cedecea]|uniref:hypothetical protein n=1 Tax=unclassified Cedecea TaxID=2649846 RepID=UPI00301A53BD
MPSPLTPGAVNPRLCSAATPGEVLANVKKYLIKSWAGEIQPLSKQVRMEYRADQVADKELRDIAEKTSYLPIYEITGPHLPPEHIDDRSRVRLGRYGARISD